MHGQSRCELLHPATPASDLSPSPLLHELRQKLKCCFKILDRNRFLQGIQLRPKHLGRYRTFLRPINQGMSCGLDSASISSSSHSFSPGRKPQTISLRRDDHHHALTNHSAAPSAQPALDPDRSPMSSKNTSPPWASTRLKHQRGRLGDGHEVADNVWVGRNWPTNSNLAANMGTTEPENQAHCQNAPWKNGCLWP